MLKFIFSPVIFLSLVVQEVYSQNFEGGIQVGVCTSQIDGDRQAGYNKIGIAAGFFVNRKFLDKLRGQFELRFIQKGASGQTLRVRLNYIGLPVGISYLICRKLYLESGFEPSFLIAATSLNGYWRDVDPRKFDLPAYLGCSYSITSRLLGNVRFSYSSYPDQKYYNNAVQFALYYKLK